MWIFCAGSKRSGSTLQYNIVSRILEIKNEGKRLPHSKPEEFLNVVEDNKDYNKYKVFKTHLLTSEIEDFIKTSKPNIIKIVYCFRDVRDVNVSLVKKGWLDRNLNDLRNTTISYLDDFERWMAFKDVMYISKYEDFYDNIKTEIIKITDYLDIVLTETEIAQLERELSADALKNDKNQLVNKDRFSFNQKTLLHKDHIQGKIPNQFKTFFNEEEINVIEKESCNWLQKYGYYLTSKDLEKFSSYSQHADDYIAWQLLGKKDKGVVVEVGAFDGQHLSNSKSLDDLGWKSINIEPSPEIFKYLEVNRPNSTNLNLAVVGEDSVKEIDFYSEELGVLSGCLVDEDDLKIRYNNRGITYKTPAKIKVQAKTLNKILQEQNCTEVDVMSIDVEGFEMKVLQGLDLKSNLIKLLIIEANNEDIKNEILNHFKSFIDYLYVGNNYQNLFFIHKKTVKKKHIKSIDFNDYIKVRQQHPKGDKFVIDSIVPKFVKSSEALKYEKFLGLF